MCSNLAIKPGALAKLNLPVRVKAGTLGLLKLHLPWHKLAYEPVLCEIRDIHLVANFNKWSRDTQVLQPPHGCLMPPPGYHLGYG